MPWPVANLDTTEFRSASGRPARARPQLKKALDYIGQIIRARGSSDGGGIAPLDSGGKVPTVNLPGLQMTQAERTKLGGVAAGAQPDMTGAEIRNALDGVLGGAAWRTPVDLAQEQHSARLGWARLTPSVLVQWGHVNTHLTTTVTFFRAFSSTPWVIQVSRLGYYDGGDTASVDRDLAFRQDSPAGLIISRTQARVHGGSQQCTYVVIGPW